MAKRDYDFWVYILASRSRTLYIGMTNGLTHRTETHRSVVPGSFTARYGIFRLVYYEHHRYVLNAIAREKQLKKWTRAQKIALIEELNPTWEDLFLQFGQPIVPTLNGQQIPSGDDNQESADKDSTVAVHRQGRSEFRMSRTSFGRMGRLFGAAGLLFITGCHNNYTVPETPMPPNTVLLSQMMRELSAQPGFTQTLLAQIDTAGKKGPALMTPKLVDELRKRILGKDWQGLDRFPGWTMREVNPTADVVDKFAGKNPKLEGMSAVHPGSAAPAVDEKEARDFLDLGPYALDKQEMVSLEEPSKLPPYNNAENQTALGDRVVRGDGPNELAAEHAESQRLADVLNRLAVNKLDGAKLVKVSATIAKEGSWERMFVEQDASTPEEVMRLLQPTGHTVTVQDARYFANFGHFHYKGQDVMMPFWINTQIVVPHSGGLFRKARPLLLPVSHAEYEWHIRGPKINADVSWYFGIDGKAEWRTMDTLDQAWVQKRNAHTYTGADAVEVTRLTGLMTLAYMHQHARRLELPFGGYYALGVCQDNVSAIEKKMTGKSTLFPNTADAKLFDDPRDAEVNALMAAIPKDRTGAKPQPERVFGSLPVDASLQGFDSLTIPGLADDLKVTFAAWQDGKLERTHDRWLIVWAAAALLGVAAGVSALARRRQRSAG